MSCVEMITSFSFLLLLLLLYLFILDVTDVESIEKRLSLHAVCSQVAIIGNQSYEK